MCAVFGEFQKEMNAAYDRLEKKHDALAHAFSQCELELESGWFNGHYQKNEDGSFSRDSYPIPVLSVIGVCDTELQFDRIRMRFQNENGDHIWNTYDVW